VRDDAKSKQVAHPGSAIGSYPYNFPASDSSMRYECVLHRQQNLLSSAKSLYLPFTHEYIGRKAIPVKEELTFSGETGGLCYIA